MNATQIIRKKRDGKKLSSNEIQFFIENCTQEKIPDYQTTAFLMATYFQGMDAEETCALTKSMIESGEQIKFNDHVLRVDKHSTGGVGDKVSIVLAPLVASLGVEVPMVAGRGLGHTGGTLDKLESIPGFQVRLEQSQFLSCLKEVGTVIAGQTKNFVPADKLLYSLRDVTATIECIPLITASILSKKAAEGISALVMDIKVGNGAFMKNIKQAEKLAKCIVSTGKKLGLKTKALLTDMNQPLGNKAGNALEIIECLDLLHGKGPQDLKDLTIELSAQMLVLSQKASALSAARTLAKKALQNGSAYQIFLKMCKAQGASDSFLKNPYQVLNEKISPHFVDLLSPKTGVIQKIETEALGELLVDLGGGRHQVKDTIDFGVGFELFAKLGSKIKKEEPLLRVYFNPTRTKNFEKDFASRFYSCFLISSTTQKNLSLELIKKVIE